jgi:hypothetical protein
MASGRAGRQSFWTTLPGVLTGVAAIVTAVAALIAGLAAAGLIGTRGAGEARTAATSTTREGAAAAPTPTGAVAPPAAPQADSVVFRELARNNRFLAEGECDDLDGRVRGCVSGSDIKLRDGAAAFDLANGVKVNTVGQVTYQEYKALTPTSMRNLRFELLARVNVPEEGHVIAVLTDRGNYAKIRIGAPYGSRGALHVPYVFVTYRVVE